MNTYSSILRTLSRKYKLLILSCVDSLTAFACWIVFGPPFTAFIASNFEVSLYQLISQKLPKLSYSTLFDIYLFH